MERIKTIIGFAVLCSIFYLGYELGKKDKAIEKQAIQIQTIWEQTQANTQAIEKYNNFAESIFAEYNLGE